MPELIAWAGKPIAEMTRDELAAALRDCAEQLRQAQERNRNVLREWRRVSEATGRSGPNQAATTWRWTW